ncbi:c-type cytochrome [Muricoccus pecuniae]|uniref:Cytochrome c2 n=1 Tax=Muricoccus pecuniae TaxID=693023 RepID=A0A840YL96_9PROT|nr:c-type cytochrome [Roseomonas pecuniae]MBB5695104.1 cytochrome c2 [Roseomonas pecuniae]
MIRASLLLLPVLFAACDGEPPAHLRVAGGDPARGRAVALEYGCGACHVIPGVRGAVSWAGPPLTEWARRGYLAGHLPNSPENLIAWLRDPQAIAPGSAMPNLGLSEAEARDTAAYLFTLGAGRVPQVPAGLPLGPKEAGPREEPRIRPRA